MVPMISVTQNAWIRRRIGDRTRILIALLPCLASLATGMTMVISKSATTSTIATSNHCRSSLSSPQIVKGLLDRVKHNDRAGDASRCALPFFVGNSTGVHASNSIGCVLPQAAQEFSKFPSFFSVTSEEVRLLDQSGWFDGENSNSSSLLVSKRSEALAEVLETMRKADSIPALRGWRDEAFSVRESFHAPPKLIVERAAAVLFGVPAYGVFVNGYTCCKEEKQQSKNKNNNNRRRPTHLWIGRRSPTKQTWPGRLDSLAAGGLGAGVLPRQAMVNECIEEAGIDAQSLEENLNAVSAVSYTGFNDDGWGLKRDVLYCFDLELAHDFVPVPVDGEMESFEKMPIQKVLEMLAEPIRNDDDSDNLWKPNVGVVLIDFLVRHGILDADDPNFLELVDALRGAKCA